MYGRILCPFPVRRFVSQKNTKNTRVDPTLSFPTARKSSPYSPCNRDMCIYIFKFKASPWSPPGHMQAAESSIRAQSVETWARDAAGNETGGAGAFAGTHTHKGNNSQGLSLSLTHARQFSRLLCTLARVESYLGSLIIVTGHHPSHDSPHG